jgi:hypothetical protein
MELKVKVLPRIFIIIGIVLCLVVISLYAICWFIVRDLYPWFFFLYPIIFCLCYIINSSSFLSYDYIISWFFILLLERILRLNYYLQDINLGVILIINQGYCLCNT